MRFYFHIAYLYRFNLHVTRTEKSILPNMYRIYFLIAQYVYNDKQLHNVLWKIEMFYFYHFASNIRGVFTVAHMCFRLCIQCVPWKTKWINILKNVVKWQSPTSETRQIEEYILWGRNIFTAKLFFVCFSNALHMGDSQPNWDMLRKWKNAYISTTTSCNVANLVSNERDIWAIC